MQKILIIAFTDLKNDSRVYRQIDFLKEKYKITTVGLKSSEIENVDFYQINPILRSNPKKFFRAFDYKFRKFEKIYWSLYQFNQIIPVLLQKEFDLIIANDMETMPLMLKIKKKAKIILDAHEYSSTQFEDRFMWRFFFKKYNEYMCETYIKCCDTMLTVSEGIANEYKKNYDRLPIIITNATEYENLTPSPTSENRIRLILHSAASPSRKIELMISMMKTLDARFTLDLMLMPNNKKYFLKLKKIASNNPKIKFIPPVKMKEIPAFINHYDIGVYILKPSNFNQKYSLPNKFFEFIQARLTIAIGPSPEMEKIVKKYNLGVIASDFSSKEMAKVLNKLDKGKIDFYKNQSHNFSLELSSKHNMERLDTLISDLLKT